MATKPAAARPPQDDTDDEQDVAPAEGTTPGETDAEAALREKVRAEIAEEVRANIEKEERDKIAGKVRAQVRREEREKGAAKAQGAVYYTKPGLGNMTDDELRKVLDSFGIKPEGQGRDALIEKILQMQGRRIGDPQNPKRGRKLKVTIHPQEGDTSDVVVAVNGLNMLIQRGKEVVLHEPFVEALKHAEVVSFTQDPEGRTDENGHIRQVPFRVPRYALTIEPAG